MNDQTADCATSLPVGVCHVANVPLKDVLWYCVVSVFLDVKSIMTMESAFTNKAFYKFKDARGQRQGLFMDVDWDTAGVPVQISYVNEVRWLQARNIRLYNVQCVNMGWHTIRTLFEVNVHLIHTIDLSSSREELATISSNPLELLAQNYNENLRKVVLKSCNSAHSIEVLTKKCPGITALDLHYACRMTDADLAAIAKDLQSLSALDLSGCNKVSVKGVKALASASGLQSLSLSNCPLINDTAVLEIGKSFTRLKSINLSRTRVTDNSVIPMARCCSSLEEINLIGCLGITRASIESIADYTNTRLLRFYLGDALRSEDATRYSISTSADESLCYLATKCPNLRALNLWDSGISDHVLQALGEYCHCLQDIDFSGNFNLSDAGVAALVTGNKHLRVAALNYCNLSEASVRLLLTCTNLRALEIRGNYLVTRSVMTIVKEKRTITHFVCNYS